MTNTPSANRPQKMKAYASFADWEKEETKTNALTAIVSAHIQTIAPTLETTVKWGQGCFLKSGTPTIYIHTEPDYVQVGFYNGVSLNDPNMLLEGNGKYVRHIKIVNEPDIQAKDVDYFIKQVV